MYEGKSGTAEISVDEFVLLLRGWRDSNARLRIAFRSSAIRVDASCSVAEARDKQVAFVIGSGRNNLVEFAVADCFCGFRDVPPDEVELPIGEEIASLVGAVRDDFNLLIMLLK